MKKDLIAFLTPLLLIPLLDSVWFGLMGPFYMERVGSIISESTYWPAVVGVYLVMAIVLWYFVLRNAKDFADSALEGALMGFGLYAVYSFTNIATLEVWTFQVGLIDTAWGTFVCGLACASAFFMGKKL